MYVRYHGTYNSKATDKPCGIFGVAYHMKQKGLLSTEEIAQLTEISAWFESHLPNPPFYKENNPQKAVTWFKEANATPMLDQLEYLRSIIERGGWKIVVARSAVPPGEVVYEDDFQIAVIW
jgi:hypothetical protein